MDDESAWGLPRGVALPDPPSSLPQLLDGRAVWPEHWGVTLAQLGDLLARLRAEPGWKESNSIYTMVQDYVVPWTKGTGHGYALQVNCRAPKEVNVMVSHAWAENAEEFLDTLLRSCSEKDVLFICALSLYQADDSAGPTIAEQLGFESQDSPFRRILEHIRARGEAAGWRWRCPRRLAMQSLLCLVAAGAVFCLPVATMHCLPLANVCAAQGQGSADHGWVWRPLPWWPLWTILPGLLLALAVWWSSLLPRLTYAGRMIVVPNREVDIYSRLWCVYEIFVARHLGIPVELASTLAAAGRTSCSQATCGSTADLERIRAEIEAVTTYRAVDKAVYMTMHRSVWKVALSSVMVGSAIASTDLVFGMTFHILPGTRSFLKLVPHDVIFESLSGVLTFASMVVVGKSTAYMAMLSVFSKAQGSPTLREVQHRGLCMALTGSPLLCAAIGLWSQGVSGPSTAGMFCGGLIWCGYGVGLWAYGLVLLHHSRAFRQRWVLCGIVGLSLACFVVVAMLRLLPIDWDAPPSGAHLYMTLFSSAALSFGSILLPIYIFWHTARWWGFQLTLESTAKDEWTSESNDNEDSV